MADAQCACLEQDRDKRLQAVGAWDVDASFPILDDATAGTDTRRQLALGQSRPAPEPQQQSTEPFRRGVRRPRHAAIIGQSMAAEKARPGAASRRSQAVVAAHATTDAWRMDRVRVGAWIV